MSVRTRIVPAVQRLALRTARTPLAPIWSAAYSVIRRTALACLTGGRRGAAAYARASMGGEDFLPGLSDIDVAVVLEPDPAGPGLARERAGRRWERLSRIPAARLIDRPRIYEEPDLDGLVNRSALSYGLDAAEPPAAFFGPGAIPDRIRMLERPGLDGAGADWRLLSGPDRRPAAPAADAQERRLGAWLELTLWWQWAFSACIGPADAHSAHLCLKLVSEPARIWLLLAHGERPGSRRAVLQRALQLLPEEEDALRAALDLRRALPRAPAPPLEQTLPILGRLSARIAALLAAQVAEARVTEVRLVCSEPLLSHGNWRPAPALDDGVAPAVLPLCDWRALVRPGLPDDAFAPLPGDPCDPAVVAAAATAQPAGVYPALRADGLLILPAATHWRSRLRAIQCATTDPVSFALLAERPIALFPDVRGWSARDTARRAVAEQRAAVAAAPDAGRELAALLTAARAALFHERLRAGEPELAVTVNDVVRGLAGASPAAAAVADDALGHFREYSLRRTPPPDATVSALRELVLGLAPYA